MLVQIHNVGKNNFTRPYSMNDIMVALNYYSHRPTLLREYVIYILFHTSTHTHTHTHLHLHRSKRWMNSYCLRVLTGVVRSHRGGPKSVGVGWGTPETEPDVYRPGERGATARTVVRTQHTSVAQPDRQVHRRAEPDAVPAKVPAAWVEERSVLVQKSSGQVQATKDVPVRRHVA